MSTLQQQLDNLTTSFLGMAALTDDMLALALRAFLQRDAELAGAVAAKDDAVDALDNALDEMCLRILALEHPVAAHLRYVVAIMRLTGEVERIADEACNMAEHTVELRTLPLSDPHPVMRAFAEHSLQMYRSAIEAFRSRDSELAIKTRGMEELADELHMRAVQTCFAEISGQQQSAQKSLFRIFIARAMERICDLSTNICELTVFACAGDVIKHRWV